MRAQPSINEVANDNGAGFTLVEVLVALFIFALIASASTVALSSTLQSKSAIEARSEALTSLQLARATFKSDFLQTVIRPTRDAFGGQNNIGFDGTLKLSGEPFLKFVKRGWLNPAGARPRANIQAVEYYLNGTNLVRRTLLRTDPTAQTPVYDRTLLSGVNGVSVQFLINGIWQAEWFGDGYDESRLPSAIALTIDSDEFGVLRQLFIVGGDRP
ncbi:type II secretion system minor pseudopilin GspJ [Kordiimonas sp. SCSIO 12610]|uniref:type II secretion system minor pseudopilin GspJ n=1 Tax=Kordiimonas sp. SCSIO 12610 TaxID=2829597 RepID=UPI00210C4FA8|nr:type II secretion system minor pseudopilin GspJ [Kordiimonas sp. SCSIO 12610]UTW56524.1 type II secretion system minor pseudopilin GspJ [Kordiimonas sp. SCSIO 12610]